MESIKLVTPHELADGTYTAMWSGDTLFIERHQVDLKTVAGVRGRREGNVIVSGANRSFVSFEDELVDVAAGDAAETLDMPAEGDD